MKPVGNLSRLRGAALGSARMESEPVAGDDLHFRCCFNTPLTAPRSAAATGPLRFSVPSRPGSCRSSVPSSTPSHRRRGCSPCTPTLALRLILRRMVSSLTDIAKRFMRNSAARLPVRWPTRSRISSTRVVRRPQGATTSPSRSRKMACSHSLLRHRHRLNRNCSATRLP